ncbi:hypothetical protein NVP1064O_30 [Vibrio phage 1.064.O._10N.261.52.E2]|nr:hypothetical protein NVP1064O_30 [Vibrio phage 1.064.O._10N.261.52.E2]AUR88096.1 hypothetical protein NVP1108O_30 [Vibrio phage 1.108.O._10N.222.51.A4]AUR96628.1 hypothetical protein NVP1228O_34 [Vibrio phage 1.228.O._10N.261.49.C1]AUR96843.1 hypothetical protein NVP1233A_30 [Vibrio phage 1.233.A._10N.261.51.E6]AUR96903.1 hypothetical protein NVP1233B_30 [Vibrio phage 1.233.B._10N.261.51.E6]
MSKRKSNKKVKQMMGDVFGVVFGRSIYSVTCDLTRVQFLYRNGSPLRLRFSNVLSLTGEQMGANKNE